MLNGDAGDDGINGGVGADTLTGGLGNDNLSLGLNDGATDLINYNSGDGRDRVIQFEINNDQFFFTGVSDIDVVVSGSSTQLRLGDGITGNAGFGNGDILVTLVDTTGFTASNLATGSSGNLFFT